LLFYRRLVSGTFSKRWRLATIGAIIFTAGYCIAFVLVLVFNCSPTDSYWRSYNLAYTKEYTCVDTRHLNPVSGALSVFSDLYSVILPMGMLRHFEAPRRQKMALNAVFSLGLLVVATGCVRTYYVRTALDIPSWMSATLADGFYTLDLSAWRELRHVSTRQYRRGE